MTGERYDVVVVPFPFTDRRASKRRSALALSSEAFSSESGHTVFAMITSAANPPWPMDVAIDAAAAGLRSPIKGSYEALYAGQPIDSAQSGKSRRN